MKKWFRLNPFWIGLVIIVILFIFYYSLAQHYSKTDKMESFVDKLSEAYNDKVIRENSDMDKNTLKDNFPLYTSESDTLKVTILRQSQRFFCLEPDGTIMDVKECQNNNSFYDWESYIMIFQRINGQDIVINYKPQDSLGNKLLPFTYRDHHMIITNHFLSSTIDRDHYNLIITFDPKEVLENTEENGIMAGEGIYAFQKYNDRSYITATADKNEVYLSENIDSESLLNRFRKQIFIRFIFENSDIIEVIFVLIGVVEFIQLAIRFTNFIQTKPLFFTIPGRQ